jgi:formamidopyrimidine-DNA glycosylase
MPELPDVEVYVDSLDRHFTGAVLERVRLKSPFLLRSVDPPLSAVQGLRATGFRRIGKRIVFELEGDLFLVLHLMIAGRLKLRDSGVGLPRKIGLAAFDFDRGTLILTEAGSKKRASLYVVRGVTALADHDPGGLEPIESSPAEFRGRLLEGNHTLKRALSDPRKFSGIGNAYSDEILHRARLSPVTLTSRLDEEEIDRLHAAVGAVLTEWTDRLRSQLGEGFPEKVTAFHPEMAVHGRYGQPCPECGAPVQRIVYSSRETNYCAGCQTSGKILADRALSRLLKKDWPRTLEELE